MAMMAVFWNHGLRLARRMAAEALVAAEAVEAVAAMTNHWMTTTMTTTTVVTAAYDETIF